MRSVEHLGAAAPNISLLYRRRRLTSRCVGGARALPDSQHVDGLESREFVEGMLHLQEQRRVFMS